MIRKYITVYDDPPGDIEGVSCCKRWSDAAHCPMCGVETGSYLPHPIWEAVSGKWCSTTFCRRHDILSLDDTVFEMCDREREFYMITMKEASFKDHIRWMQHAFLVGAGMDIDEAWRAVDGYGRWSAEEPCGGSHIKPNGK